MKAIARNIRISPRKLNVIAAIIRNMDIKKALDTLRFMSNKGAVILYDVLHSAVNNATHNDMQELANLTLKSVSITKGIVYKRGNPISRGRTHPILKRTSNVLLELGVK